jgi:hypothetical protein
MSQRVEDEYSGVLQKLECGICMVYDECASLTDYEVIRLLENLINRYKYESGGRKAMVKVPINQLDAKLYGAIAPLCENYLGRDEAVFQMDDETAIEVEQLIVDELLLCLKRLLKSAKHWNKTGGRKGYLNFIAQFMLAGK